MEKIIKLTIEGKDNHEIAKKIVKIQYLLSFLNNNNKWNLGISSFFIIIAVLLLIYIFFGIYVNSSGIYSSQYLKGITQEALQYTQDKNNYFKPTVFKTKLVSCGSFYCIGENSKIIEKPKIESFIILEF